MGELLPQSGVKLHVFQRKSDDGVTPISASRVRALLKDGKLEAVKALVPETTYAFLASDEGKAIIERMK